MIFVNSHLFCNHCIFSQVLVFAMYRQDIFWSCQSHHQFLFILTCVTGYMDVVHLFIDDLCTQLKQFVNNTVDKFFISRDWTGRNNDKVVRCDLYLAVFTHCHSAQSRHRLTLASGSNQHHFIKRQSVCHVDIHQNTTWNLQITQFNRGCHNIDHAASRNRNFLVVFCSIIDDLLDSVDIGREGRNDDSAISRHLEQFVKRLSYCALARRAARHLHIGGIRQKCQNTLFAQLSKTTQINDAAFNWSIIDLKVSSLYNNAGWGMNRHRTGIRNRVVYPNKFHRHTACLDNVSRFYFGHANLIAQSMLFELVFNQSHCQLGCIQRSVNLLH